MNESDFENELRKLRPTVPSARLEKAIDRELAAMPLKVYEHPRSVMISRPEENLFAGLLSRFCWACGGAAAAVVTMVYLNAFPASHTATSAANKSQVEQIFEPAESSRKLLATEDGGVVYTAEEEPARVVRYNSMERYVWANPTTGARVEVEVPREDVVLVPVSFQ